MKKIFSLLLTICLVVLLVSCGKDNNNNKDVVSLKVWGSSNDQMVLGEICDEFTELYPDVNFNISITVMGEPDARSAVLEDPSAAPDVFGIAGDHIRDLVNAGALLNVEIEREEIEDEHTQTALDAASINNELFAFPATADNGYFMYYDKRVVSQSDLGNWNTILTKAQSLGKKVYYDISNGFYIAGLFFATGGQLYVDETGELVCDFNNANGLKAAKAGYNIGTHSALINGVDEILISKFGDEVIAGVSGPWNYKAIEDKIGAQNLGLAILPEFTVDGTDYQMYTFAGFKLTAVSATTKFPDYAVELAKYITGYRGQELKFLRRGYAPTNPELMAEERVQKSQLISVLAEQMQYGYSQKDAGATFWTPTAALGQGFIDHAVALEELQSWLDEMVAAILE